MYKQLCVDVSNDVMDTFYNIKNNKTRNILGQFILNRKQWPQNFTIQVGFMSGTASQQQFVKRIVLDTFDFMNLKWEFIRDPRDADIRITFDPRDGAWSYLGIDCLSISKDRPTMNLGWLDNIELDRRHSQTSDHNEGGVVKHEFGHALSLIHQHQNPSDTNPLPDLWDWNVVIDYLSGGPNNWTRQQIKHNMYAHYSQDSKYAGPYDSLSIMHYSFPPDWFKDPNDPRNPDLTDNQTLSTGDIDLLSKKYPKIITETTTGHPGGTEMTPEGEVVVKETETTDVVTETEKTKNHISIWLSVMLMIFIGLSIVLFVMKSKRKI